MLKIFKNFNKKDVIYILISIILIIVQVWLELKMPDYMSEITKLVQTAGSKMSDILIQGGYMLLCALGSLISSIFVGYFLASCASSFSKTLRKKIFVKVENLSVSEIKKFSISSLITRTTNDVTQIEMFIAMGTQLLFKAPITAVWAVTKILNKSWQWSAITAVAVVILLTIVGILISIVMPKFKIVQKLTDNLNKDTRENLTGIRVIRAFNAEKYQTKKFDDTNQKLTNQQMFNQKTLAILQPVMFLIMNVLLLIVYFTGSYLINGAVLSDRVTIFSNMVVFSSYAIQVIMSFLMLAFIFMILPRAQVSAERINEVLNSESNIKNGKETGKNTSEIGVIEFNNVSFKYPDADEYLLKNISFKAEKGNTIAFIGSTGSGKSTLINLIPRFYDATDGEILIDGINVKDYNQKDLYNKIGYVSQKAVMFNDTVEKNVSFGYLNDKKPSLKKIKEAIKIAQAEEFILNKKKNYKFVIAQNGTNLSGGQKQRISIARAIARNPEIYIFDDTFSALDYKTDLILRKELKKYTKDATILIVAQRIGTIINADKIIVLENGKCVGIGTHKELLSKCKVYKEIALSQLSEEELKNA